MSYSRGYSYKTLWDAILRWLEKAAGKKQLEPENIDMYGTARRRKSDRAPRDGQIIMLLQVSKERPFGVASTDKASAI